MADYEAAFKALMEDEIGGASNGGYVNDPADRGGETKYGISKRQYPKEDIKNLTLARAKEIYRRDYWAPICGDEIQSQPIAEMMLDMAVHFGVVTAVKMVQAAVGVTVDGSIGSKSVAAINLAAAISFLGLLNAITVLRIQRYVSICKKNPSQKRFLLGWVDRALRDTETYRG